MNKTILTINPKIIIGLAICLGFFFHFLGFELDRESYKDVFFVLVTIFVALVALIVMLLMSKLKSLEQRRLSVFQDLRNVIREIRSYVILNNSGGIYHTLVRFDYEPSVTNDLLLENVDKILEMYKTDTHFRRTINEDQNLQVKLSVELNVATENVHKIDRLSKKAKLQVKDLLQNMFAIIAISIIFLAFRNINISSPFFQWFVDILWEPWLRSLFLMVVIGFSIVTLIKAYNAIKSLSED